jgi:hypothetical protein
LNTMAKVILELEMPESCWQSRIRINSSLKKKI